VIEEPDRHGQVVHGFKDVDEVFPLQRKQFGELPVTFLIRVREYERLDESPPITQEHVLSTAQTDALRSEPAGPGRVVADVGVGSNGHSPQPIRMPDDPVHSRDQVARLRRFRIELALEVLHHR
jgi:hypothetical protein